MNNIWSTNRVLQYNILVDGDGGGGGGGGGGDGEWEFCKDGLVGFNPVNY